MTRLLAVSGSLRRESANSTLLRAAAALAPPGVSVTLFEGVGELPHFNPDIEHDDLPAVLAWRRALADHDGVVIACPEYAHGVPGAFKNALDWAVGSTALAAMPVALINTSARAVHAHAALMEILVTMGWQVIGEASLVIAVAGKNYSVADITADASLGAPLQAALGALVRATPGKP